MIHTVQGVWQHIGMVSDMDIHNVMLLMTGQVIHAVIEHVVAYTSAYGHIHTHYMHACFLNIASK